MGRRLDQLEDVSSGGIQDTDYLVGYRPGSLGIRVTAEALSSFITVSAAPVQSVAGKTGDVTLDTADISGLGGSAALNVGTTAGTVAAGDDSRFLTLSGGVPRFTSIDLAKPGGGYIRVTANDDGTLNYDPVA